MYRARYKKRTRTNWDKKERRTKDMTTKFPLRTKRKMETRLKLVRSARHLFLTKGYDNTTLEEVAEAAGLHVQTLYRHFGTKQDLAKAGDEYWLRLFEEAISKRDVSQSTFAFWRNWMSETVDTLLEDAEAFRSHLRMSYSTPTIMGATLAIRGAYEDLLTKHLAKDFGMPFEGVTTPRLVAGMLMSGNHYVRMNFKDHDTDLKAETLQVIDTVTEMFSDLVKAPAKAPEKVSAESTPA
jgi:AcrR family transcriptional regulator